MQLVSHPARRVLAMTLILGHLLTLAMAGAPSFHRWLHGDADAPDHSCAVVAALGGQIDQPDAPELFRAPERLATGELPSHQSGISPSGVPSTASRERAPPEA